MNLLLLDQFSDLGGAQLCLLDLLPAIRARGWRAVIAAPGDGALFDRVRAGAATVERIHLGPYSNGSKNAGDILRFSRDVPQVRREIRELIERYRIELLYVNGPRLIPPAIWAAGRHLPVVFHCHSSVPQSYGGLLVGRPLRWAGATVISSSRFAAESISRYVDRTKLHVVYNGVPDCARPKKPRANGYRIGMIGRIAPQKGQVLFVQAARILLERAPKCHLEICGSALFADSKAIRYQKEVQRLASGLPVDFTGWTDDIASVLARLDMLVVPSIPPEATTRVILEAFSAGVPVVAFAAGGIPEIVSHGRTGLLVDQPTPEALGRRLETLVLRGVEDLRAIADAARQKWETHFTLARYQEDVLQLLERAGGGFESSQKHAKHESREGHDHGDHDDDFRIAKA